MFAIALALTAWAIATLTRAGFDAGPYRFTRNPIYFGMIVGLIGLAIAFDSLWLLDRRGDANLSRIQFSERTESGAVAGALYLINTDQFFGTHSG